MAAAATQLGDPEGQQQQDKAEAAAWRSEMTGLFFNALSTVFGTGMSLFAKVSGDCLWERGTAALGGDAATPATAETAAAVSTSCACRQPGHRRV